ncbi:hypothetical protein RBSH_04156 [Rhodopirellula baltica SH28]|uniref:DinB-like domain-containing protein n=1 Tax=Rhodopirellula baltica SH28 TaxID=993517 RepID=K5DC79_RHOBT|nr:DinB family protein [Rhodopirellula baltica]EKK00429.1 hypothetical protein RBSH_04156 [Rhodopirellula baltica SH28]
MNSICFWKGTATSLFGAALLTSLISAPARAAEGDPVAVRVWPGGTVTIESHWGLSVAIKGKTKNTEDLSDEEASTIPNADATVTVGESGRYLLSRPANKEEVTWQQVSREETKTDPVSVTPNDIQVSHLGGDAVHVQLDGIDLVVAGPGCTTETLASFQHIDAVIGSDLQRFVVEGSPMPVTVRNWISASSGSPDSVKVADQDHNTVAISSNSTESASEPVVVWWNVSPKPWQMSEEMNKLFAAMEKSCAESQAVFAKLTTAQMNFKPANGTHTPRWNVEHMMGRQLLFFSQMYHEADASIPVMDLNPAQMPPDYEFANADWDGAEEARQMQRVSDFSRRFAYLLDGYSVDDKVPGSRWPTLKALLKQMDRHYSEHTSNTEKKFALPGWPKN